MSLPIQKSTAKNFVATDSEISSKTATLPMQRWTTKKCAAVDAEIGNNGGVVFGLTLSFFGCLHSSPRIYDECWGEMYN
jgi:hypothetical protein